MNSSRLLAVKLTVYLAVTIAWMQQTPSLSAQSKLGAIRETVRKNEPKAPRSEPKSRAKPDHKKTRPNEKPTRVATKTDSIRRAVKPHAEPQTHRPQPPHRASRRHRRHFSRPINRHVGNCGLPPHQVILPPAVHVRSTCYQPIVTPPAVVVATPVYTPTPPAIAHPPTRPNSNGALSESPMEPFSFEPTWTHDAFQSSWGSLWATLGTDFDDFTKTDLGLRLQVPGSIGVETSVTHLRESGIGGRDHIWLGDANLTYEAIHRDRVRARLGVGFNWLNDGWGSSAGFNLTSGVDVHLHRHWLLCAEADLGSLGDADFFHGRFSINRRWEEVEWATGMDHLDIGGVTITSLFTGIQFRF